jgi:protein required for attachment to host cells
MKPARTLIVVADGERARFLLHEGIGRGLKPAVDQEMARELPPERDIVTEKPGRDSGPAGTGTRHALAHTVDHHEFAKERFAHEIAEFIQTLRTRDRFDRLVLVLPPKALGHLREALDKPSRDLLIGELAKDLTHMKESEIAGHLGEVMAV